LEDYGQQYQQRVIEGTEFERHLSVNEISEMWGLCTSKVRRMFQHEPGVMKIGEPSRRLGSKLRRSYFTLRIPVSVAQRVHDKMCNRRVV